ncbi:DUF4158 domain-containing protein [Streptosporangium sp. LJ11]|uniref:DUF4158 domain-containing protein n=1 Tax=Streptosporangium sp. LJ11 TaxID=3436927 RepID=UPI003F78E142
MFSQEQLEQLRSFPEVGRDELITHFTLTPADVAFVDPGRGRGPADRLGMAVMVATLPWLGFVPDEVSAAPPENETPAFTPLLSSQDLSRRSSPPTPSTPSTTTPGRSSPQEAATCSSSRATSPPCTSGSRLCPGARRSSTTAPTRSGTAAARSAA